MTTRLYPDGAQSKVPASISSGATTITLTSAASFGSVGAGQQIDAIIVDTGNSGYNAATPLATPYEYVIVTAIASNVLTITRGQYGSSAASFYAGATISGTIVGQALTDPSFNSLAVGAGGFTLAVPTSAIGVGGVPQKLWTATIPSGTDNAITYSSIPQSFRHLDIVWGGAWGTVTGPANLLLFVNGDTSSNYYNRQMYAFDGNAPAQAGTTSVDPYMLIGTKNTVGTYADQSGGTMRIYAYSGSNKKVATGTYFRNDGSNATNIATLGAEYAVGTAITSLEFAPAVGSPQATWSTYDYIEVYGIP